jgi:hypothetical protein
MAVWLSRKAGEAYEAGAFWEKFCELIGLAIPLYDRQEFARRFQLACRKTMLIWLPPKDLGGQQHVAEFLYQAGLPLERCERFAQHFRKVERAYGLPDENAPDAGDQLRELMLESLHPVPIPSLKRALRGPAGARICEVALFVVINRDYTGVNPRLGQELDRVFEHAEGGTLRRSTHQPFLRLGEDLGSVEIVGPRQDASEVGVSGLTWLVNGRRFPTMRNREFEHKVTEETRVTVEPLGLIGGAVPPRNFTLQLDDRAEPFILFDARTRRERRLGGLTTATVAHSASGYPAAAKVPKGHLLSTPPGSYWLLHRSADSISDAEQRYDWPDGERSLSFFTARPGTVKDLEGCPRGPWDFITKLVPSFEASGDSLSSSDQVLISFGWAELPVVWIPVENEEILSQWYVNASAGSTDRKWTLTSTSEKIGGMVKCRINDEGFLDTLLPAMYRTTLTLHYSGRKRSEAYAEYLLWHGLRLTEALGFHVSGLPNNIIREQSVGFDFHRDSILHKKDQNRIHALSFDLSGTRHLFKWSQPGIYLDSLDRRPGQQAIPLACDLGSVFSAVLNSTRSLRLWLIGERDWKIFVAGTRSYTSVENDRRDFVEFSLANLAISLPEGGDIWLQTGVLAVLVARFSSPLKPIDVEMKSGNLQRGFKFMFSEPIKSVRPAAWDLSSGQRHTFERLSESADSNSFIANGLPNIECICESESSSTHSVEKHFVTVSVPTLEWPTGFWLIELEVRRNEGVDWQSLLVNGRESAPIVIDATAGTATLRASLLKASLRSSIDDIDLSPSADGYEEIYELLVDLITLRKREYVAVARHEISWLKDTLRSLGKMAGRILRRPGSEALQVALLNVVCLDPLHSGFVYLPELLALPAADYCELPSGDPLNEALRRCGRLAQADSIAALANDDPPFLDFCVLGYFSNFVLIATTEQSVGSELEFDHFAYERFSNDVAQSMVTRQVVPDWTGDAALGEKHRQWAFNGLVKRYETAQNAANIAAANTLLHLAPQLQAWLDLRLRDTPLKSFSAWHSRWLRFVASAEIAFLEDFLEAVPRFASLFALAARASAAGLLPIDETLRWLEGQVRRQYMAEEGIAALVGLAPEIFGYQLLFWELMIRTVPH